MAGLSTLTRPSQSRAAEKHDIMSGRDALEKELSLTEKKREKTLT
jgi:hypothetical protein